MIYKSMFSWWIKKNEIDTTVVTVQNYSFNYLIEKLQYSFPGSPEERRIMEYMAFYRTRPVSAITHYGKVKDIITDVEVDGKYRLLNFGDRARDEATTIIFENISELKTPVKAAEGKAIQGTYYTNLEYVKKAETIPELWKMKKQTSTR